MLFSEPKIPQYIVAIVARFTQVSFSALQRAENSSMRARWLIAQDVNVFQCSSASRKFLNRIAQELRNVRILGFSALQRAENSSMFHALVARKAFLCFSALQRAENSSITRNKKNHFSATDVSVLFSEPKIPQSYGVDYFDARSKVSVLFSEPKIPQSIRHWSLSSCATDVSVLFSEPKIPQFIRMAISLN